MQAKALITLGTYLALLGVTNGSPLRTRNATCQKTKVAIL